MADFQPDGFQLRWQLLFEDQWPTSVALLGSGRRVAAGNRDGELLVWDLPETPPEVPKDPKRNGDEPYAPNTVPALQLLGHTNAISRLIASADGRWLFSASFDHTICIWDLTQKPTGAGSVTLDARTHRNWARNNGRAHDEPTIPVQVETIEPVANLLGHEDWIMSLAMSRDGKRLLSGDGAAHSILWDVAERKEINRWDGRPWNWVVASALSTAGDLALSSEYRYKRDDFDIPAPAVKIRSADDGTDKVDVLAVQFEKFQPDEITYGAAQVWRKFVAGGLIAADFSPDGQLLALGQGGETDKGEAHLIEVATGKLVRSISGHQYGITDLRFTDDGKYLLTAGRDTTLRICQVEDGKEVAQLGKPRGGQFKDWLSAISISPDGQTLAASDIAGLVQIWQRG